MLARAGKARVRQDGVQSKPVLDVLLLYEDLCTALRAKRSLDRLSNQLGVETRCCARLWRLDLLGESLLAEQAAVEAAAADVIILSVHGHHELRAETRAWLSRWLALKADRPYALAALLDPEPSGSDRDRPVLAYLKRIVRAAHADFFCAS
jgi:hypothetical protein